MLRDVFGDGYFLSLGTADIFGTGVVCMFSIIVGFDCCEIEKEIFYCEGFNVDTETETMFLLDSKENANIIGYINLKRVFYFTINELPEASMDDTIYKIPEMYYETSGG